MIDPLNDPRIIRDAYAGRLWPRDQLRVFSRAEDMFPTRTIRRGGSQPRQLPASPRALADFAFQSAGASYDLFDFVSRNRIVGLLVVREGQVVLEHYECGLRPETRWISMSMAKSVSATLVGVAIKDGLIDDLDDLLSKYLPALRGGAYEDVTIRQLLRMSSGVQWNECHTDPESERTKVLELQIAQQPGAITQYLLQLPKLAPAGSRWNYSTGETHMVGLLLRAVTGAWLADYLSEKIWSIAGMEADATWWLEAPGGLEIAGSGISATLRDFARFGLFLLERGEEILPAGWLSEAGSGYTIKGHEVPYGYMWWPVPTGGFSARGIFGQRIHVNPACGLVVTMLSARSKPMHSEVIDDNEFFRAVAEAL